MMFMELEAITFEGRRLGIAPGRARTGRLHAGYWISYRTGMFSPPGASFNILITYGVPLIYRVDVS